MMHVLFELIIIYIVVGRNMTKYSNILLQFPCNKQIYVL